jgi:hypothetical protein
MSKMDVLILALGWVLTIEGLLPMIAPGAWKKTVSRLAESPDQQLRITGTMMVALGMAIVWMVVG